MKYTAKKVHDPIDPNVPVPAAIRAASARASELHKQLYEEQQPSAPEPTPAAPVSAAPVQAPEPQPPASEPAPTAPAPVSPTPAAPTPPPADGSWEQRFNAMKGRYDRAASDNAALSRRISQLEGLLAQPRQPEPVQQPTPDLQFKPITQDEKENYGDEFIDVATRAAAEKFAPVINGLRQEVASLKGSLTTIGQVNEEKALADCYAHLDDGQPNWRELNRDPKFLAWASLPDPYSGAIRLNMMREAFDRFDGPRVLRFFQGFLRDEAASGPAPARSEIPPAGGKVPLEQFAAPGRAKAPAATEAVVPEEKEVITAAQISRFYVDVAAGKYRGREEEKNRLEREIFEAQSDGRVR